MAQPPIASAVHFSRRKALKRLGLFAGLAASGGLLAACQAGSTQTTAQPTGAPKPPAAAPTTAAQAPASAATAAPAAKASGAGTRIVFARTRDSSGTTDKLVQTFNQRNTGVTVEPRQMPDTSADYRNILVPQLQAKSGDIDVFTTDVIWTGEFAAAGWVDDLSQRFTQQMKSEFLPGPLESTVYNGKSWMVPYWTDAGVFYYRQDVLRELGTQPPKTWDELVKVGTLVKEKKPDMAPYIWQAAVHEGLALNVMEYIWSNGGEVLNDRGEVVLNSPNSVEALQFLTDSIYKYGISPEAVTSSRTVENNQVWFEGRAAMMRSWPFVYGNLKAAPDKYSLKVEQIGLTNLPAGPKGTPPGASTLGGWNCALNAFSKNKEATWTFVEWLTGPESQKMTAIGTANPMTRKAIYQDPEVVEKVPITRIVQPMAAAARSRPVTPFYQDLSTALQRNFHAALTRQVSPADAIKQAHDELVSIQKRTA